MRVFVWGFAPKPRMLVFGAIDFAAAVARVGSFLGYHVTVCDARPVFATSSRFPEADEVVVEWPHRYLEAEVAEDRIDQRTVLAVLTHDPKFDVPLLEVALRMADDVRPGFIGAMGSRRTHEERLEPAARGRADRRRARPAVLADRPRPGRAHSGGDGSVHRRGDRGQTVGRFGERAGRDAGAASTTTTERVPPASAPIGPATWATHLGSVECFWSPLCPAPRPTDCSPLAAVLLVSRRRRWVGRPPRRAKTRTIRGWLSLGPGAAASAWRRST